MTSLRLAVENDFDAILAVHSPAGRDESRKAQLRRSLREKNCLVAAVDGRIVGYAVLEYTFYENGFLSLLLVHAEFRRRGVGSQLVTSVASSCRTPKLFTSTNLSNIPMQSLLAKQGFSLSGVINDLDEGDPELVYVKKNASRL
jgi:N-acetylglutamate synthase-like GNAT family acetyltransferase